MDNFEDENELKKQALARLAGGNQFSLSGEDAQRLQADLDREPKKYIDLEKNLENNPLNKGLMEGGFMGGVGSLGKAAAQKATPGAFGRIQQTIRGGAPQEAGAIDAVSQMPAAIPEGFVKTAAKLESSHPAMVQNRSIIDSLVNKLGLQHPDVATLQQIYNKMLK